ALAPGNKVPAPALMCGAGYHNHQFGPSLPLPRGVHEKRVRRRRSLTMDITPLLERLRTVSNDELRAALRSEHLGISNEKFQTAFQCVGASHDLSRPDIDFRGPPDMPEEVIRGHRLKASVVF